MDTILQFLNTDAEAVLLAVILFILSLFVKIPKLEINIWELIGNQINKGVEVKLDKLEKRIDDVDKKVQDHIEVYSSSRISMLRYRILDFNDGLRKGSEYSDESWNEIMRMIDEYETYCSGHPDYKNNLCVNSIKHIIQEYQEFMDRESQ